MLSEKNLSPRQLSALTAILLTLPISIVIGMLTQSWAIGGITLLVIGTGSFLLVQFTLEQFIYRQIKLIYKFINRTKATRREEIFYQYIIPRKSLDEVRKDVEAWGEKQHLEIEMLRRNEAYRKEFLQNLAHEFKTPVFAIQGYVETLLNGALDERETAVMFLENTRKNTERLVNLMNDLDEISRLERGEHPLVPKTFIIQELIREVFDSLSIHTRQKEIRTLIKRGCEAPLGVYADRERIRQVLINLIENASKYGRIKGTITASIYRMDEDQVLVEISDDGIGIGQEHLPRIFERFYRTDDARSRDKGGTGLGLAISKHIIEAHGQTIHVRSTPDVGTTIGFTLAAKKNSG